MGAIPRKNSCHKKLENEVHEAAMAPSVKNSAVNYTHDEYKI